MGNLLPSTKHKKNILNLSLSLSLCSIVSSQSRVVACALECMRVLCVARMRSSRINGTTRYWIVSYSFLFTTDFYEHRMPLFCHMLYHLFTIKLYEFAVDYFYSFSFKTKQIFKT